MKNTKIGFTLAETLIVIGIIGIVAAITLPTLIKNHQKKVYYTQFMKANSILQQAIKMYQYDNDYDLISSDGNLGEFEKSFASSFPKYVKVAYNINQNNYEIICKGYDKLKVSSNINRKNNDYDSYMCSDDLQWYDEKDYAYITTTGILISFSWDVNSSGGFIDINGPDKGPNTFGRDIFFFNVFDIDELKNSNGNNTKVGIFWTGTSRSDIDDYKYDCYNDLPNGMNCAGRLLREGKMNY